MNRERTYHLSLSNRRFIVERCRVRKHLPWWEGKGNPWLWFSYEQLGSSRAWFACGTTTMREAWDAITDLVVGGKEQRHEHRS